MTDRFKIDHIDNEDGTITTRVTEDISDLVRVLREKALRGEVGVIYNIGPEDGAFIVVSPLNERDLGWKKAGE